MTNEQMKLIFDDYVMDYNIPDNIYGNERHFKKSCFSKWAALELYNYIIHKGREPCTKTIEEFILKMNNLQKMNSYNSFIFKIAKNVAEDILDIFRAMR